MAKSPTMTNQLPHDLDAQIASLPGRPKDNLRLILGAARELFGQLPKDDPKGAESKRWIEALEAELAKR